MKNEAVTIAQLLYGGVICILIVLGMSGSIYKVIGPHGMFERIFGTALQGEFTLLLAVLVVSVLSWTANAHIPQRLRGRVWSVTIYMFGMLGALFAVRLATLGSL